MVDVMEPVDDRTPRTGLEWPSDASGRPVRHRAYSGRVTTIRGRFATLVGSIVAALILGHYALLLLAHGPSVASGGAQDGHEASPIPWFPIAAMATLALAILAIRHVRAIARLSESPRRREPASAHLTAYLGRIGRWWVRLLVGVTLLYLLQENIEYLRVGASLPGLDVLHLGEHGAALPLIALATLVVAAIVALADWCCCVLAERLAGRRASTPGGRTQPASQRRASDVVLASTIHGRRSAGRSPPTGIATPG